MKIEGKTILVTGATGFLGAHLIRSLSQHESVRIRGLTFPKLLVQKQFDQLPFKKVPGDMTSIEDMRKATHGCDIVVHCAVGEPRATISGTRNAVRAAAEHGVKKFIHISSTAVFGYSPSATEITSGRLYGNYSKNNYVSQYSYSKIASENIAFSYYDSHKLPLVVLRPSNIFGPHSRWWTIAPIRMLEQGSCVLIDGGLSPSNSVYVENVVDAIKSAIQENNAVGKALTINNDKITPWKDFFSSYANMFSDPPPLLNITSKEIETEKRRRSLELLGKMIRDPKQTPAILRPLANLSPGANRIVSPLMKLNLKKRLTTMSTDRPIRIVDAFWSGKATDMKSPTVKLPEFWLQKTFTFPFHFSNEEAAGILGFKCRVSFEEGMKITKDWVQHSGSGVFEAKLEPAIIPELTVPQFHRK